MVTSLESTAEGDWLAPGSVSSDGVAIVGYEHFLFLLGGSNHYYAAYSQEPAEAEKQASTWLTYLEYAQAECDRRNIKFLFGVVPNKATILPEFYPRGLNGGITPRMEFLMSGLTVPSVVPVDLFRNFRERRAIFRRNDSHFGDLGNRFMVQLILEGFGVQSDPLPLNPKNIANISHAGDLGGRFDPKMTEILTRIVQPEQESLLVQTAVPSRGFTGTMMTTENSEALIDKTLVIFGNSFIEKIPSWGMSPLLARIFRHLVFYWGDRIDFDFVEQQSADFVLFQTCERFLGPPPA